MTLTGVKAHFSASHYDDDGRPHGHSYIVWLWVNDHEDAARLQSALADYLTTIDHKTLEDELRRAEGVAELVGTYFNAQRVVVDRPVEGLAAEWCAEVRT